MPFLDKRSRMRSEGRGRNALGVLARSVKREGKGRAVSAARQVPELENGDQHAWSGYACGAIGGRGR